VYILCRSQRIDQRRWKYGNNIKYALFVWNSDWEARYDTTFIPQISAVRWKAADHIWRYTFTIRHGRLSLSSPLLLSKKRIFISFFDLKGSLIRSVQLPSTGVRDLKTVLWSEGNYLLKFQSEETEQFRKIRYLK
jgi:hypothetical protein